MSGDSLPFEGIWLVQGLWDEANGGIAAALNQRHFLLGKEKTIAI